ncbi:MAG TPA: MFS transporter, partial [Bacillota bacterium]|nr:MFS transporter [Bacillota bacterium]
GYLSDRGTALRTALPAALCVGAVAAGLLPFAGAAWVLLALAVAAGLTGGAFHPPAMAWVRSLSGAQSGRGMALFGMAGGLGRATAPLILAALAVWAGQRSVSWLAGGALAVGIGYLVVLRRQPPAPAGKARTLPLGQLFAGRWGPTASLLAMTAAFNTVSGAVLILVPIAYRLEGQPLYLGAVVVSVMLLAGSFGNALGGTLSDLLPRDRVVIVAAAASALSLTGFVLTRGAPSVVFAALTGLFSMSTDAMSVVICQDLFPESVAMASGLSSGLGSAMAAAIVVALSLVAGATSVTVALLVAAAVSLAAIPAVLPLRRLWTQ